MEVVCLILGPMLTSGVSIIPTLFADFLRFDIQTPFIFIENVLNYVFCLILINLNNLQDMCNNL